MRLRNIPGAKDAIAESIYVIQNPQENKGNWDKVFPQHQPVHLEVGMGKGRFMRLRNIPGAKDAIEESIYVIQNPQENKGNWNKIFPQNQPVHLEVGMGKGRFLMDMAKLHPEINYIGIEMYDSVLLRAIQKKEALAEEGQELSNLKFMRMDARLLPEVFEKGEVSRIYLNFSDPWPKARHASRRLTSSGVSFPLRQDSERRNHRVQN